MTARLQSAAAGASLALCLLAGFAFSQHDDRGALFFLAMTMGAAVISAALKPEERNPQ
jgi:peptidoglycan/LPS O-acetylase OafA/YrhL